MFFKLTKKIGKLELRIDISEKNKISEIVEWVNDENCIAVCHFVEHKEGYSARFVYNRPFELENQEVFWHLLKFGQQVLNAQFEFEKLSKII